MWNVIPDEIKKIIIQMNPSLKEIHSLNFKPCIKAINLRRYERMCAECTRGCIFGLNSVSRKPSVKMFCTIETNYSNVDDILTARLSSSCKDHIDNRFGFRSVIKNGMELDYGDIIEIIQTQYHRNISSVIKHTGCDEDHIDILNSIVSGESTSTFDLPVARWQRIRI